MTDLKLSSSIPSEWRERFLIKRIDEEDIEISLPERNAIIDALNRGARFIQLRKYTLMINAIKSIDPLFEPNNIPPRPQPQYDYIPGENDLAPIRKVLLNEKQINDWEKLFGHSLYLEGGVRDKE